jgi:hypothetical protein
MLYYKEIARASLQVHVVLRMCALYVSLVCVSLVCVSCMCVTPRCVVLGCYLFLNRYYIIVQYSV